MLATYKIIICISAIVYFTGFIQASFMPSTFIEPLSADYNNTLMKLTVNYGFHLLILSAIQFLAAVWTFQNKVEGVQLGLLIGLGMLVTLVLDFILVNEGINYPLLGFGAMIALTSFLLLYNESPIFDE